MKFFFLLAFFSSIASAFSPIITVEQMQQYNLKEAKRLKVMENFRKDCDTRIAESCISLAHFEALNEVPVAAMVSLQNEKSILQNKCNKLDMNACFYLAQMISNTENDFLEVKNLLERACYYFQHRLACESLADFEDKMGLGDSNERQRVCAIVDDWCVSGVTCNLTSSTYYLNSRKIKWLRSEFFFYKRLIYQMSVQDWIPRGLTIIPLEMTGVRRHVSPFLNTPWYIDLSYSY